MSPGGSEVSFRVNAFGPYLNTTMLVIPINVNRTVKSVAVDAFQKK